MSLLAALVRQVYERRDYVFYRWDGPKPGLPSLPQGISLTHYRGLSDIPEAMRPALGLQGSALPSLMGRRMAAGTATLWVLHNVSEVLAHGFVQTAGPFRHKFKALMDTPGGSFMLGPYQTQASQRGKGYYGLLLQASLSGLPAGAGAVIFTHPDNAASMRGIEKAGFAPLGTFELKGWLGRFYSLTRKG